MAEIPVKYDETGNPRCQGCGAPLYWYMGSSALCHKDPLCEVWKSASKDLSKHYGNTPWIPIKVIEVK